MKPRLGDIILNRYALVSPLRNEEELQVWQASDNILERDCQLFIVRDSRFLTDVNTIASTLALARSRKFTQVLQLQHIDDISIIITALDSGLSISDYLADNNSKERRQSKPISPINPLSYEAIRTIVAETAGIVSKMIANGITHHAISTDTVRITTNGIELADTPISPMIEDLTLLNNAKDDTSSKDLEKSSPSQESYERIATRQLSALLYSLLTRTISKNLHDFSLSRISENVPSEFRMICKRGLYESQVADSNKNPNIIPMASIAELSALLGKYTPLRSLCAQDILLPRLEGAASVSLIELKAEDKNSILPFPEDLVQSEDQFNDGFNSAIQQAENPDLLNYDFSSDLRDSSRNETNDDLNENSRKDLSKDENDIPSMLKDESSQISSSSSTSSDDKQKNADSAYNSSKNGKNSSDLQASNVNKVTKADKNTAIGSIGTKAAKGAKAAIGALSFASSIIKSSQAASSVAPVASSETSAANMSISGFAAASTSIRKAGKTLGTLFKRNSRKNSKNKSKEKYENYNSDENNIDSSELENTNTNVDIDFHDIAAAEMANILAPTELDADDSIFPMSERNIHVIKNDDEIAQDNSEKNLEDNNSNSSLNNRSNNSKQNISNTSRNKSRLKSKSDDSDLYDSSISNNSYDSENFSDSENANAQSSNEEGETFDHIPAIASSTFDFEDLLIQNSRHTEPIARANAFLSEESEFTGRVPVVDNQSRFIAPGEESARALREEELEDTDMDLHTVSSLSSLPPSFEPREHAASIKKQQIRKNGEDIADAKIFVGLSTKFIAISIMLLLIIVGSFFAIHGLLSSHESSSSFNNSNPWDSENINNVPFGSRGILPEEKAKGHKVPEGHKTVKAVPAPNIPVNNTPFEIDIRQFLSKPSHQNGYGYYMHLTQPQEAYRFVISIRSSGGHGYLFANTKNDPTKGDQVAEFTFDESGTTEVKFNKPIKAQDFLLWVPANSLPNNSLYINSARIY
ncbi:kinase [uncultured Gardnerella sp.]|uniref:kinase n=1 Tax=uncultured Gardnerella sp. TaxID=293424 RepID=UPI0025E3FDD6|nr:kinase [uncultured Gardnerella sp.]